MYDYTAEAQLALFQVETTTDKRTRVVPIRVRPSRITEVATFALIAIILTAIVVVSLAA